MTAGAPVDRSGVKLGLQEHREEHFAAALKLSDFIDEDLPEPPCDVDRMSAASDFPMLGNDRYGDCVIVGIMHFIRALTAVMGREKVFSTEQALAAYSEITGFREDDPDSDQGTNLFLAIDFWRRHPEVFGGVEIEGVVRVDIMSWPKLHQAIWLGGGVITGIALPVTAQRQRRWKLDLAGGEAARPGSWGNHCVTELKRHVDELNKPILTGPTWGEPQEMTSLFSDVHIREAWLPLIKGWEPPDVPGFNRDALLRAMRAGRFS